MALEALILLAAIPTGFLITWLARDELIQGRKWFRIIVIASVFVGGIFVLIGNIVVALSCFFILIATFISYVKSFDKNWTKTN